MNRNKRVDELERKHNPPDPLHGFLKFADDDIRVKDERFTSEEAAEAYAAEIGITNFFYIEVLKPQGERPIKK